MITILIIALQAFHIIDISVWWLLATIAVDLIVFGG